MKGRKSLKQLTLKTLMLIIMLSSTVSVSAYDFEVDGIYYYVYSLEDLTLGVASGEEKYSGDIVIPETVTYNGHQFTVKITGDYSFLNCTDLTSVSIPNTVTSISFGTFYGCSGLKSINIPNSVTTIQDYAFLNCSSLTDINIPNSVTTIGNFAFQLCSGLTNINIPNSVTSIGKYAFWDCSSLTSFTIPSSVMSIDDGAFGNCYNIKNLVIEDGEETLNLGSHNVSYENTNGYGLFYSCPIETLYLGRNINYIQDDGYGYSPFNGATILTDVTIGSLVTNVECINWWLADKNLSTLHSLALTPPFSLSFSNSQYMNVKVYVPEGSLANYLADDVWKSFWNIHEGEPTGVSNVEISKEQRITAENGNIIVENANDNVCVYNTDGTLVKSVKANGGHIKISIPQNSVYIVKTNGKVVKIAM